MLDPKNFSEEIKSKEVTLVEFGASWCQPCKMMKPILAEMAKTKRIIEIDCDESPAETSKFSISSVPTFLFFKDGEIVKKTTGMKNKQVLLDLFGEAEGK